MTQLELAELQEYIETLVRFCGTHHIALGGVALKPDEKPPVFKLFRTISEETHQVGDWFREVADIIDSKASTGKIQNRVLGKPQ